MLKITFSDQALNYLKQKELIDQPLILIADDGGGKYSMHGGACSIGAHFSLIWVKQPDPDYPLQLKNEQGLKIYTSKYDETVMGPNLKVDYKNGTLNLRDDEGWLDGGVEIGNGPALLKANQEAKIGKDSWSCS